MSVGKCYLVASPVNEYRGCTDPPEPPEEWRDVVYVYARNARRARVLALRWFRRQYTGWERRDRFYLSDSAVHPFSGMLVERVVAEPSEASEAQ